MSKPAQPGSLHGQFLRWLLIPLIMLVVVNAFSVYNNALEAADLAYDRSLLSSARALGERVAIVDGKVTVDVPYVALDSFETDTLGRLYYRVTGIRGEYVSGYEDLPDLPRNAARSDVYPALVHFFHAEYQGQPVRVAALHQPVYDDQMRGIALVEVAETLDARRGLSRKILIDTLMRQALLVLAVAGLVWLALHFVLQPLLELSQRVAEREPTDLSGFSPDLVHHEVRPLILAMNGYMQRLDQLISSQKRFIADASHQLRTPLTVLKTQAELALREQDPEAMRRIVESIATTTDTTVRTGHGLAAADMATVNLADLARTVCLELALPAVRKQVDLELDAPPAVYLHGHALLLQEMLSNLVDNAIRYTPAGGSVTVRLQQDGKQLRLSVCDTGPGLSAADQEKAFEPFFRASGAQHTNPGGSGLGLAIVHDIVMLHHGQIRLSDACPQDNSHTRGLCVTIHFACVAPPDSAILPPGISPKPTEHHDN